LGPQCPVTIAFAPDLATVSADWIPAPWDAFRFCWLSITVKAFVSRL
jgi:hypothetical protein